MKSTGSTNSVGRVWQHRGLLWQFVLREVELRHKGSHLGLAWSVLNPLLMLGLYVFVFGIIFGGRFGAIPNETHWDYSLGVFMGLTLFHLISEVMGMAPSTITANPNFVKKVVFPLEILPAAQVGASVVHMLISLSLLIVGIFLLGSENHWGILWLPVLIIPLILLAMGMGWFLAGLGVFLRDINQVTQFFSMGLLFGSAIFYPISSIPEAAWTYMRLNPILLAVDLCRRASLWDQPMNWTHLGYIYAAGLITCFLGYRFFTKMKPAFADVI